LLGASGALFVLTAVALWAAVDLMRLRRRRNGVIALAVCLPLAVAADGFLWLGLANPTFNFRNNQGFPGNWSCLNLGKGSAQICGPDRDQGGQRAPRLGIRTHGAARLWVSKK
jgi:hypothetical protein